jgi:hypothetical protein
MEATRVGLGQGATMPPHLLYLPEANALVRPQRDFIVTLILSIIESDSMLGDGILL